VDGVAALAADDRHYQCRGYDNDDATMLESILFPLFDGSP
jgi:hypothetical protein